MYVVIYTYISTSTVDVTNIMCHNIGRSKCPRNLSSSARTVLAAVKNKVQMYSLNSKFHLSHHLFCVIIETRSG